MVIIIIISEGSQEAAAPSPGGQEGEEAGKMTRLADGQTEA